MKQPHTLYEHTETGFTLHITKRQQTVLRMMLMKALVIAQVVALQTIQAVLGMVALVREVEVARVREMKLRVLHILTLAVVLVHMQYQRIGINLGLSIYKSLFLIIISL